MPRIHKCPNCEAEIEYLNVFYVEPKTSTYNIESDSIDWGEAENDGDERIDYYECPECNESVTLSEIISEDTDNGEVIRSSYNGREASTVTAPEDRYYYPPSERTAPTTTPPADTIHRAITPEEREELIRERQTWDRENIERNSLFARGYSGCTDHQANFGREEYLARCPKCKKQFLFKPEEREVSCPNCNHLLNEDELNSIIVKTINNRCN